MKSLFVAALTLVGAAQAATKYAFPYFAEYPYGARARWAQQTAAAKMQQKFTDWKSNYYAECPDGQRARVLWKDYKATSAGCTEAGSCTVSEGIGYGMLITVYMDNATNNTKPMFDKLWKYYQSFLDDKGLMHWKIDGCNSAKSTGAATDAEMDVAVALAMAYKQWGNESYLTDVKALLGKMWTSEVDGNKLLKPGSQFGSPYNPSYFAIGALRLFATVDPAHDWKTVADNSVALLKKNQNPTTGLNSDWCNNNGNPVDYNGTGTSMFGFDAVRTPWRVAVGYAWFGGTAEKEVLAKMNTWIRGKWATFGTMRAEVALDGSTVGGYVNALYKGAYAVTGMINPADTTWLTSGASSVAGHTTDLYYNDSWQLIYLLTLTGNFQNFWGPLKPVGVERSAEPEVHWSARTAGNRIEVVGKGAARAELLDAHGRLLGSAQGTDAVAFERPAVRGVYFVRVSGDQPAALSIVVD